MELAHLPYRKGKTYEDCVGLRGLEKLGKKRWRRAVADVTARLATALEADCVVLGGGNAKLFETPPDGARLGDNANAFRGGFLLWNDAAQRAGRRPQAARRALGRRSPQRTRAGSRRSRRGGRRG